MNAYFTNMFKFLKDGQYARVITMKAQEKRME